MTTIALKHITIAIASKIVKGSFRKTNAMIEIQNGLVLKTMMIREMGARGVARLKRLKALCPAIRRIKSVHFCSQGKFFSGFERLIALTADETNKVITKRQKMKSTTLAPSAAAVLNATALRVRQMAKILMATTARQVLFLVFGYSLISSPSDLSIFS